MGAAENAAEGPEAKPAAGLAQGKIGDLNVSRMLLGGNLLMHYTHSCNLK